MTRTKGLAIAMYLGAALAGAATALAVDRATGGRDTRAADTRSPRTRYFDELKLTPQQRDSATAIFEDRDRRYRALMEQRKAILDPIRAAQDTIDTEWRQRFTRLLTPEQKAIYDQMQQARREREKASRGGERR